MTPPFDLINTTAWIIRWSAGPVHYVYIELLESVNLSKAYKLGYLVHIPLALEGSERRNGFVEAFECTLPADDQGMIRFTVQGSNQHGSCPYCA